MPLPWQRQEYLPTLTRTLGTSALAILFFVQDDGILGLTPAITSKGELATHFPLRHIGPCILWITLRALSIEADSPLVRLKIDWSGRWRAGKAELERECTVTIEDPGP